MPKQNKNIIEKIWVADLTGER